MAALAASWHCKCGAVAAKMATSRRSFRALPPRGRSQGTARRTKVHAMTAPPKGPATKPCAEPGYRGALVSTLPEQQQQLVFAGINAAVFLGTAGVCTVVGPFFHDNIPFLFNISKATWPLIGVTYVAAGVAHFKIEEDFVNMMPHQGAWGFWELPGSDRFHVQWTGVAEVLGGTGLLLGALPFMPTWLEPASAWGLLVLSVVVYPANIYMYTHNAQGPGPPVEEGEEAPLLTPPQHAARAALQVLLMSLLWACAHK